MISTAVHDHDEFTMNYPPIPPPQGAYSVEMGMPTTDAYHHAAAAAAAAAYQAVYPAQVDYDAHGLYETPYLQKSRSSSNHFPEHDPRASTMSTASGSPSTTGSPLSNAGQLAPMADWPAQTYGLISPGPGIVDHADCYAPEYQAFNPAFEFVAKAPGFVDPSLIHPDVNVRPMPMASYESTYPPPSAPYPASPALSASPRLRNGSASPFHGNNGYPYSAFPVPVEARTRRPSPVCFLSGEPPFSGDEARDTKQPCPHADCGKTFKDLKAHMLTHQNERPEKCPIASCEYHIKGFARKYDKNRHTLTHYKGTMVCGFCPGSGSATEKSFNRADVFKRHLTAVHGVEQTPPNSRKKAAASASASSLLNANSRPAGYPPDATGKCSTCSQTFANAQDFYEHLDDCVLRIVQQEDPAEAVNARRLAEVESDGDVHATLERNNLAVSPDQDVGMAEGNDEDANDTVETLAKRAGVKTSASWPVKRTTRGNPVNRVSKSRAAVTLASSARARKNRKEFPSSWGFPSDTVTLKKRVLTVFDGQRRLAKDDMMLSTEHEVRVRLADGKSYVTDLDVQTLRRADGLLGATQEEKSPWDHATTNDQFGQMLECQDVVVVAP